MTGSLTAVVVVAVVVGEVKESRHRKENQRPPDLPVLYTSRLSLSRFRFSLFLLRFSSFLLVLFCPLIFKHKTSQFFCPDSRLVFSYQPFLSTNLLGLHQFMLL